MTSSFRRMIGLMSLVLLLLLTASCSGDSAPAEPAEDAAGAEADTDTSLAGQTIVVSWPALSHFEKAQTLIPQFEEETGINVEVDSIQYLQMRDKQVLEMSKEGTGEYDVVAWVIFNKTDYVNKGYLAELAPFFTDAELADPNYDPDDIVDAYLTSTSAVGGRRGYLPGPTQSLYGIPFGAETSLLAYRTDIFEEYDLEVPTTYDELLETATFITENVPDMYGFTSRGSSDHQIVHSWLNGASPFGAGILDDEFRPTVESDEAKAATEMLKALIEQSPPGVTSWGAGEMANAFLQGESAMYLDAMTIAAKVRDPEQSLVEGNVGYALHPAGPAGISTETGGFAMGIPNNADNKEAAFTFIQWMTSKEQDVAIVEAGGDPIRKSTLADPELQERFPEYQVILEGLEYANPDWRPLVAEWGALNAPIMGVKLGEYVSGQKDLDTAMAEAADEIEATMERAGYYTTNEERYAGHEGETVVVSWPALSHFEKAGTLVEEFEAETGINVEIDSIQYLQMRDKQVLEMSKEGTGEYDVVAWVIFNKTDYVNKGYLAELSQFFTDPTLADPAYDPDDIVDAYLTSTSAVGGRRGYLPGPTQSLYGIPFGAETSLLAYRTDIFEEYDLEVPTTYDELLETATFITENVPDMYGFTSRGSSDHQIVHSWLNGASPFGAGIIDDNYEPTVESDEAKAATEMLKALIEQSPPGVTSWGAGEMANAFLQGESAMYLDAMTIAAKVRDPEQSLVEGNVGYALHPAGPAGISTETGGFAMGVPNNASNPEAAFLFIQWMTSKAQDVAIVEAGGDPIRESTLADPALQERFPEYQVILEGLEYANPDWRPLLPEWGALNAPIMGVNLGEYVSGQATLDEAMANAAAEIRDVLERAGYYSQQAE